MTPARVTAQAGAPSAPPSPFAIPTSPQTRRVAISKAVYGDAGMIVNARDDGFIEVAAAGPAKTVLVQMRTLAARGWVDSTYRMLRARPRRSNTPRSYRSEIQEHGSARTMALTRKVTAGESEYALYFADDSLSGFTIPIEQSEADVFLATVRRAVDQSAKLMERADSTAPRPDSAPAKKPKPAVRRRASPPAKDTATTPVKAPPKPATPR